MTVSFFIYRKDGVKIDFDPYAPGMAAKYGLPGSTDPEGFDPYADTVSELKISLSVFYGSMS